MKLEILKKTENWVAVNKPAGMLTIPDRFNPSQANIKCILDPLFEEVYVVHRLDRDTSGLVIFALNAEHHKSISSQFQNREVKKTYLAVVDGFPPSEGLIDAPLAESTIKRGKMLVHQRGKEAITSYKVLERFRNSSLCEINIHTGRMHQIRVHFAHIGHPLFVDSLYGKRDAFWLSELKGRKFKLGKYEQEEKPLISRQTLHALRLEFKDQDNGQIISIEAPIPKDLAALINQLRKFT